jgi:F-type H+-transporting ATPase subunit epsilon
MAGRTLKLEICAPGQDLVELDVTDVIVPGEDGVFTVYPGHTPLLSTLIPGVLVARDTSDREHLFAVHGGFAEVKDGAVIILADIFESQDDIDTSRAEAAEERARELLRKPTEDIDWTRAEAALARATARIRATSHHGYH